MLIKLKMSILFKYFLALSTIALVTLAQEEGQTEVVAAPASEPEREEGENRRVVVSDTPPELEEGQVAITKRVVHTVENEDGTTSQTVSYETVQINEVDENGNVVGYKSMAKKTYPPVSFILIIISKLDRYFARPQA
jgi:hypothetical protein